MAERSTVNRMVPGSNPGGRAKCYNYFMEYIITSGARYQVTADDPDTALALALKVINGSATAEESALVFDLNETGTVVSNDG